MFRLDPRLEQDTVPLGKLPLAYLRLMCDGRYPWVILVPARPDLQELHDLAAADRIQLVDEMARVSRVLQQLFKPDKINIGALGNVVPQLHIHVVARHVGDPAWPGLVWGYGPAVPYTADQLVAIRDRLVAALTGEATEFLPSDD